MLRLVAKVLLLASAHKLARTTAGKFQVVAAALHAVRQRAKVPASSNAEQSAWGLHALDTWSDGMVGPIICIWAFRLSRELLTSIVQRCTKQDLSSAEVVGNGAGSLAIPSLPAPVQSSRENDFSAAEVASCYADWVRLLEVILHRRGLMPLPKGWDNDGLELCRCLLATGLHRARNVAEARHAVNAAAAEAQANISWWLSSDPLLQAPVRQQELAAKWAHIVWWEGPDMEGHLQLHMDATAFVGRCSNKHEGEECLLALLTQMESLVRVAMPAGELQLSPDSAGGPCTHAQPPPQQQWDTHQASSGRSSPGPAPGTCSSIVNSSTCSSSSGGQVYSSTSYVINLRPAAEGAQHRRTLLRDRIVVVIHTQGCGLSRAAKLVGVMRKAASVLAQRYPSRLRRLYVVDLAPSLSLVARMVLALVPRNTREKVKACSSQDLGKLCARSTAVAQHGGPSAHKGHAGAVRGYVLHTEQMSGQHTWLTTQRALLILVLLLSMTFILLPAARLKLHQKSTLFGFVAAVQTMLM